MSVWIVQIEQRLVATVAVKAGSAAAARNKVMRAGEHGWDDLPEPYDLSDWEMVAEEVTATPAEGGL